MLLIYRTATISRKHSREFGGSCCWCSRATRISKNLDTSRNVHPSAAIATTHSKICSRHLRWTWQYILPEGISNDIYIIQVSCCLASSINESLLWQQRNSKILSKWSDSSRRPTCLCDTLVCVLVPPMTLWLHLASFIQTQYISYGYVVDAINKHPRFALSYPDDHYKQQSIAAGFAEVSSAGFGCCSGALDGILDWIISHQQKIVPTLDVAQGNSSVGETRSSAWTVRLCAMSGADFWTYLSRSYPGSTSDYIAFEGMSLFHQLEQGILAPGLCLFGDNAYLNSTYMATPYAVTSSGTKDAYNFYHSQLRIRIECAFGMLKHRWAILRAYLHTEECTCAQDSCTCFGTCKTAQILYQRERSRLWCCLQYCNWWVEKQGEWRCSVGRNTPTVQRWCPQCWHYPSLIAGLFVTILMISL